MSARRFRLRDGVNLAVSAAILRDAAARPHLSERALARMHRVTVTVVRWVCLGLARRGT